MGVRCFGRCIVEVAAALALAASTLAEWWRRWQKRCEHASRGRRARVRRRDLERALLLHLVECPTLPVRDLHAVYPELSRRRIVRMKHRVRWLLERRQIRHQLRWNAPGTVWAMDFKSPPSRVEGVYVGVLVVRDLASGMTLAAEAMPTLEAREVAAVLERLFRQHGAPLAMKNDNGSNLIAAEVRAVLDRFGVLVLRSPPGRPSYNGSCEAGIGSISRRAEEFAAADGRPGRWTCDDLESARELANHEGRPRSAALGHCPATAWAARAPITRAERAALRAATLDAYLEEAQRIGADPLSPDRRTGASLERAALSRALCRLHYLTIRRR